MSKAQIQPVLDTEAIIAKASSMNIGELEHFVQQLNWVISQKKAADALFRQRVLLRLINETALSPEKCSLYLQLVQKLENETITDEERQRFLELTEEEETLRNERVKMLIELAQIRNVPLNQVMEELGLQPIGHG